MTCICARETAGVDVDLASSSRRFGIKMLATALAISRNPFVNARPPVQKRGGLGWLTLVGRRSRGSTMLHRVRPCAVVCGTLKRRSGRGVEQTLRQRCDTGRQSLPFMFRCTRIGDSVSGLHLPDGAYTFTSHRAYRRAAASQNYGSMSRDCIAAQSDRATARVLFVASKP